MIKVEAINKSFQDTKVLDALSFEILKGDFIAIMGPSGSGKSTLMYSISGMDHIDSGNVYFDGVDLSQMGEAALADLRLGRMGFVFQNVQMLKNLTLFDNIILPALVAKKGTLATIKSHANALMKQMGIEGLEERDIREVSGGQLQRAAICRAMINHPDILFLDEPTGALNSKATNQVLDILEALNQEGMTIMTVTHEPHVAARAKKVIYVIDGQIAACKTFDRDVDREKELAVWLDEMHF